MHKFTAIGLLVLSFSCSAATKVIPECEWAPGTDRYTGDKLAAVDELTHIPKQAREKLKQKMEKHAYDDIVVIHRNYVEGPKGIYGTDITNMRSGANKVCKEVTREKWSLADKQEALVYRVDEWTILDPAACGNIAEIASSPKIAVPEDKEDTKVPYTGTFYIPSPSLSDAWNDRRRGLVYPGSRRGWSEGGSGGTSNAQATHTVPEPSSLWLLLTGLVGLLFIRKTRT